MMKLKSGAFVSAFDLHKEEKLGHLKIDLLATKNLTRMRTCLDLLAQYNQIEKKPTLRETYESVLGVYTGLERNNPEMWKMLADGKVISAFQFETDQGTKAIKMAQPKSVEELTALNSIMRLMSEEKGAEQPLDKFQRFKGDKNAWEREMDAHHLTSEQKALLHRYLDYEHGICAAQEDIMSLIQEPELGGWSLLDADRLRKSVAKKDKKLYEALTEEYFKCVKEKNLDENFCNYFWKNCVGVQKGYSFNLSHTLSYALVCVQNMNLAYRFPVIFWNTANLIVDSAGIDDGMEEEDISTVIEEMMSGSGEEEMDSEEEENANESENEATSSAKKKAKPMNYGKVSAAIGKFQSRGINILPPSINISSFTFTPDIEQNAIHCGLRGITRVSTDLVKSIIAGRPYSSMEDFCARTKVNITQLVNLIKSGAFDEFGDRETIMYQLLEKNAKPKSRLTLQNMASLVSYGVIPEQFRVQEKLYEFNKFMKIKNFNLEGNSLTYFCNHYDMDMIDANGHVNSAVWKKYYDVAMVPLKEELKTNKSILENLNKALIQEQIDKYAEGTISKWEMDSISCYYHAHELDGVDFEKYGIVDFYGLPEEPLIENRFESRDGKEIILYKTMTIAGTVLDKNKMKHTVTILTPTGVVNVKVWNSQFVKYDKQLSVKGADGKKKVLEKSWFSRGNLVMFHGIRRGNDFIPKTYKNSIVRYPIRKITAVNGTEIEWENERLEVGE